MKKLKSDLIKEVEDLEEKVSILEQDIDYYNYEYNKLESQKFHLINYLKDNNYNEVLKKIKELENIK